MHKSRLAGFIIDCNTPDLRSAAEFWGGALGMDPHVLPGVEGDTYMRLVDPEDRLHVEVQTVTHPSRVHLDIDRTTWKRRSTGWNSLVPGVCSRCTPGG